MKSRIISRLPAWVLLLATGCSQQPAGGPAANGHAEPQQKVAVVAVEAADLEASIQVPGTVEGYEQTKLMSRIEGYVGGVLVDIGDAVTKGQTLAQLDVPEVLAEVEQRRQQLIKAQKDVDIREAEVHQARSMLAEQQSLLGLRQTELARMNNLVEGGALQQEKLDEAQYAYDLAKAAITRCEADIDAAQAHVGGAQAEVGVARADLQQSEALASYTKIVAPYDGLITERRVDPGAFVRPAGGDGAEPLFEIAQVDRVRVVLFIEMKHAAEIDEDDTVLIEGIQGLPNQQIEARIARYAKSFQAGSRMMRAEIDLENPPDQATGRRRLQPGDYGMVTIALERHHAIPSVPLSAVGTRDGSHYVMVVEDDHRCSLRTVEVAITENDLAGLSQGVELGERVVATGVEQYEHEQQLTATAVELIETERK